MFRAAILLCAICICTWMYNAILPNSTHRIRRHLSQIPPEEGVLTDFSHLITDIPGTTYKSAYTRMQEYLNDFVDPIEDVLKNATAMKKAIDSVKKQSGGWDKHTQTHMNQSFSSTMHSITQERRVRRNEKFPGLLTKKPYINNYFDIVIRTGLAQNLNTTAWLEFLEAWRPVIENCYLIVMQQGDPQVDVPFPAWANYILFNSIAVEEGAGSAAWLFDMQSDSPSAYSYGVLMADSTYVYFLHTDTLPARDTSGNIINPLDGHLINLESAANIYYMNNQYNPHIPEADFGQGYPASLRHGINCAVSMGPFLHSPHYDSLTRLGKGDGFVEERRPDVSTSVPHGTMFSMTTKNLAIHRRISGPLMYFPPLKTLGYDIGNNIDVLVGWVMKKALDHYLGGVAVGGTGYVENHVTSDPLDLLSADMLWAQDSEKVIRYLSETPKFEFADRDYPARCMYTMATYLQGLKSVHPVFDKYSAAIMDWLHLYGLVKKNVGQVTTVLRAARAKYYPAPESTHRCAMFTVSLFDTELLPVFARYYSRHFNGGKDVYVYEHLPNASYADMADKRFKSLGTTVNHLQLYGVTVGRPVYFIHDAVQVIQRRLLRANYTCVLYADVDEMIMPDPKQYPGGLNEYLTKFSQSNNNEFRVIGMTLGQIEQYVNNTKIESKIDWTKPLLTQRSYWTRTARYDKCSLSKLPTRWRPGFHNTFPPPVFHHAPDLYMLHLPDADKDFCMKHEEEKYNSIKDSPKTATSAHIWDYPENKANGKLCRFAQGYIDGSGIVWDSKNQVQFQKMDDAWKSVIV